VIDRNVLLDLFSIDNQERFRQEHKHWVETELQADVKKRKGLWSESIAIASEGFIEKIQQQLGLRVKGRPVVSEKEGTALKEASAPYNTLFEGKKSTLRPDNSYFIDINTSNSGR
jgi:REP-associated tyrosine transposase